jgi:hypothetical protein
MTALPIALSWFYTCCDLLLALLGAYEW